jgi:hypothetical protein
MRGHRSLHSPVQRSDPSGLAVQAGLLLWAADDILRLSVEAVECDVVFAQYVPVSEAAGVDEEIRQLIRNGGYANRPCQSVTLRSFSSLPRSSRGRRLGRMSLKPDMVEFRHGATSSLTKKA